MNSRSGVLLILKPSPAREALSQALGQLGFRVEATESTFRGISGLARASREIVVFGLDDVLDEELEAIKVIRQDCADCYIVVTFSPINRRRGQSALRVGADAYVLEPLNVDEVCTLLGRLRPTQRVTPPSSVAVPRPAPVKEPPVPHTVPEPPAPQAAPVVPLPAQAQPPAAIEPQVRTSGVEEPIPASTVGKVSEEQLVSLRKLGASVAHEINNPLTTLSGWIQLLLRKVNGNQDMHRTLLSMKEEADRIADVVRELSSVTEPQLAGRATVDINTLMTRVIDCFRAINGNSSIQIKTVCTDHPVKVTIDLDLVVRAVCDLLNGRHLDLGNSGSLVFRAVVNDTAELHVYEPGSQVNLGQFHRCLANLNLDQGESIGEDLALARAKQILDSHHASFRAECDEREGLSFVVKFPPVE